MLSLTARHSHANQKSVFRIGFMIGLRNNFLLHGWRSFCSKFGNWGDSNSTSLILELLNVTPSQVHLPRGTSFMISYPIKTCWFDQIIRITYIPPVILACSLCIRKWVVENHHHHHHTVMIMKTYILLEMCSYGPWEI